MVTMKDVMMASSIGEELIAYGRKQGLEEGRLIECRELALIAADAMFPGALDVSRFEAVNDLEGMRGILQAILAASRLEQARAAVEPFRNS